MFDLTTESKAVSFKQGTASLQTVLTELKKSHPELSLKVQVVQLECNKLLADQQQVELEHNICQEQLHVTHQQLLEAKAVADVEALQKELATLPAQVESSKTLTFTSLQTKLEALQKSCQEQQTKLTGELRKGLETRQKQLEKAKSEWQQSVLNQQKTNQAAQAKLKTEVRQLEEHLSRRIAELSQRVNHLEAWAESVKSVVSELKDSDFRVRVQVQTLQTQLTQLLAEQQHHQTQRTKYQAELEALQAQLAKAPTTDEINKLEAKLKGVEEQFTALSKQTLNAQSLHSKLEALQKLQEDKLKTLNSNQRQEIEAQQKRVAQLKSLQTELTKQVEKQNQQNQAQLQTLKSEIRHLEERFKKELAGIKKEVKETKIEVKRVEAKVDKVETKFSGLEAKVDAQDPRYTVAVKILKLRTAILEDQFITNELKYYVAPNGEGLQGLSDHQPLYEWTQQQFLDAKAEPKVLLLQGIAGAGKSTFNRYLMRQLWQDEVWRTFKPGMPAPKAYLPIFIPLGSPQIQPTQLLKYLNDLPELVDNLTDREINILKTEYQLLLIADGYDEMPGNQKLNLYDSNQLRQYPGIKLVIGCRTQRAQELNETDVFTPHNTTGQPQYPYFKRRHVSPFNDEQIKDYIGKYLTQNQHRSDVVLWKNSQLYLDQLSKLPDLKALLTTPFALLMSIEVMPSIVEEAEKTAQKTSDSKGDSKESKEVKLSPTTQFTRAKLYDAFMDHWFKRQAEKARQAGDTTNAKILIQQYRQFCFKLAEGLRAAGVTAVQYPFGEEVLFEDDLFADKPKEIVDPKGPRGPWVEKLLGTENRAMLRARKGAPLTVATGNYYQFIHASFIDYFSTTAMVAQVRPIETVKPAENKIDTQVLQDTASSSLEVLLGDKPMSREQFYLLADRLQQEPALQSQLLSIIERSKQSAQLALAAANAISSLNAAGVSLSGYDFRGIRIPGADLSGALLHGTQLQGADLTGVNLQGAWLMEAQLQRAHLKGIRFGEQAFIRLEGKVRACQYSPDGGLLAISVGQNIELYDAATRCWVQIFWGHGGDVVSVAWDSKGECLASGSEDCTVRVWEVRSGCELLCLQGHTDVVWSVSWDSKDKRLASGSNDGTVRVWEVDTRREMRCFEGHTDGVRSVSWDGKGERLASGSYDGTVRIWEVDSCCELRCLKGNMEAVLSVSWDVQGVRLASGCGDNTVRVWEVDTGRELRCLKGHMEPVYSVSWDVQGERLASGSEDRTVRVWDVGSGRELRCLKGHTSWVSSVSWDAQGKRLASGSEDHTVRVWEVASGRELRCFKGHTNWVNSVSWDGKGERLASGSEDHTVRVWDAGSGRELRCLKGHLEPVYSVSWDIQGERLASGSGDTTVRVWEVDSGRELRCLRGHKKRVSSVSWDDRGERLASGSEDQTVRVWEVDGGYGEVDSDYGEVDSGYELRSLNVYANVTSVSWDAGDFRLASGNEDHTVRIWNASSGRVLSRVQGHTDRVSSVSWNVSGRLASGSWDHTVRVWKVDSFGSELHCLKGHTDIVESVVWDSNGERLVSGSVDNTVRLWEVVSGKELFRWLLPQAVRSVALAPSNVGGEEVLAVVFGNAIGCFELVSKGSNYTSRLKWLAVDGAQLHVSGLDITDAQGLSPENGVLLQQRGAIGKPATTPSPEIKETKADTRSSVKQPVVIDKPIRLPSSELNKNKSDTPRDTKQQGATGKPVAAASPVTPGNKSNTPGDSKDESKQTGVKGLVARFSALAAPAAVSVKASAKAPAQEFKATSRFGRG